LNGFAKIEYCVHKELRPALFSTTREARPARCNIEKNGDRKNKGDQKNLGKQGCIISKPLLGNEFAASRGVKHSGLCWDNSLQFGSRARYTETAIRDLLFDGSRLGVWR
jgi:hypothetical protein